MKKSNGDTKKMTKKINIMPYLFIAPAFIVLIVFLGWPLIMTIIKSFYRYDALSINEFVGLENYKNLIFHDQVFWQSMKNILILFCTMHIAFVFPIIGAKMVYSLKNKRLQYGVRTIFTLPMVVPTVLTMMLWRFIYYPKIGLVARVCEMIGVQAPNLLGNSSTALFSIVAIGFPWISGLAFLMYFAALQSIDKSLIEAASIDGAGVLKTFFKIELPILIPQIKVFYLLGIIGEFQSYERYLILTDGGPNNSTLVPGLHMYHHAFPKGSEAEYGYACAIATIIFIITLFLTQVSKKIKKRDQKA